ncbi:MAG: hypothetical protein HFJ25_00910 [Clostridia bacterium]|nr:hypothetical protein [Clostridia bacterium]
MECIMQASCYGLDVSYMTTKKDVITLPFLKEIFKELEDLTKGNDIPLNFRKS